MRRLRLRLHLGRAADSGRHLDDTALAALLSGVELSDSDAIAAHLAACAACRHRMELADPMVALFAGDAPLPAELVSAPIAMPQQRRGPQPRWQLSAGVAMAALAGFSLLAVNASHRHPAPAPPVSQIARINDLIRTAVRTHDAAALHTALDQAQAALPQISRSAAADPAIAAQLATLHQQLAALPPDDADGSLVADVEAMIPDADAASPPPGAADATPSDNAAVTPADSPSADPDATPSPADTPMPDPNAAPSPDPNATPAPADVPTPDPNATPAPTDAPAPDPNAMPSPTDDPNAVATPQPGVPSVADPNPTF